MKKLMSTAVGKTDNVTPSRISHTTMGLPKLHTTETKTNRNPNTITLILTPTLLTPLNPNL